MEFLQALVSDWIALMSGIAGVVLMLAGAFLGWTSVPGRVVWIVAVICLLCASARIWYIEHAKVTELETTLKEQAYPALDGHIRRVGMKRPPDSNKSREDYNKVRVSIIASIRNTGMDSYIDGWRLHAHLPDGRTLETNRVYSMLDEEIVFQWADKEVVYKFEDALDNKLPVKRGDQITGILSFEFSGLPYETFAQLGTQFILLFNDIRGQQYATSPSILTGRIVEPLIPPGTKPSIQNRTPQ